MRRKGILTLFSISMLLVSCGEVGTASTTSPTSTVDVTTTHGSSVTTSGTVPTTNSTSTTSATTTTGNVQTTSSKPNPTTSSVPVTPVVKSVRLTADKETVLPGEEVQLTAVVVGENLKEEDQAVAFSVETGADFIEGSISETGLFKVKKEASSGSIKVRATSKIDSKISGEIEIKVTKPLTQQDLKDLLAKGKELESSGAKGGEFKTLKYSDVRKNYNYSFSIYKDAAQTVKDIAGSQSTVLNTDSGGSLTTLTLTSNSVTETTDSSTHNQELVKSASTMFEFDVYQNNEVSHLYGLNEVSLNYLTGDYFGVTNALKSLEISKKGDTYLATVSFVNANTYYSNSLSFSFDDQQRLIASTISINGYASTDFDSQTNTLKEGAKATTYYEYEGKLIYGERVDTDDQKLKDSNYKVKSFEIDDSRFVKENGKNVIYLGDSATIGVKKESPKIHLPETYRIIKAEPSGVVSYQDDGLNITATSLGTTTLTIESATYLHTETIEIEVEKKPATSISFVGKVDSIDVGQTVELSATVLPYDSQGYPYTIALKDKAMEQYATIQETATKGKFALTGKAEGQIVVVASVNGYPDVKAEMAITIVGKPEPETPASDLEKVLVSAPYKDTYATMTFKEDHTGTFVNKYGTKPNYTFAWTINKDVVTLSDIKLVSGSEPSGEASVVILSAEKTKTGKLSSDGKIIEISYVRRAQSYDFDLKTPYEMKQ